MFIDSKTNRVNNNL